MREFLNFCLKKIVLRLIEGSKFGLILSFILGSLCSSEEKKRKKRINQGMETITNSTCLWVVRKNLTSIMKVLLVGFCRL